MATKTVSIDKLPKVLVNGLLRPLKNTLQYFRIMGGVIDRDTQLQFQTEGARGGTSWARFSPSTLKSKSGQFNIRYGTDLKGRPKGTYKPGVLRNIRRYDASSKLMQASGLFRKSFRKVRATRTSLTYGSRHELAKDIQSNPSRQVLVINAIDNRVYTDLFRGFVSRNLIY